MKQYFLVDSENVNDNWLMLFDLAAPTDDIIVFYTSRSPHMSYASVIRLLKEQRKIAFEECFEGNNGLDFQLVSYLGYLISENKGKDAEFIIMSNDTGFDACIKYWKTKNISVKRINVNYCKITLARLESQMSLVSEPDTEYLTSDDNSIAAETKNVDIESANDDSSFEELVSDEVSVETTLSPVSEDIADIATTFEGLSELVDYQVTDINFDKDEVNTLICCLGKNNLATIHNSLIAMYASAGTKIYQQVKGKAYLSEIKNPKWKHKEKIEKYCSTVFKTNKEEMPLDFADFIIENEDKCKNLNAFRPALLKKYGNESGLKYYAMFKPHCKVIVTIK